jgi:hypothetical protein
MHPAGDEIVILMSGAFALQIEMRTGADMRRAQAVVASRAGTRARREGVHPTRCRHAALRCEPSGTWNGGLDRHGPESTPPAPRR